MKIKNILAFFFLISLAAGAPAQNKSVYTDLIDTKCKTVESTPEEGGSYRAECKGVGGYKLHILEGDLRQTINVITPAKEILELDLWQAFSGFSSVGPKAEWRMKNSEPIALIVRFNVSENAEDTSKITSYLVVSKITKTTACIVGSVRPGKNQNADAQKLADSAQSQPCEEF